MPARQIKSFRRAAAGHWRSAAQEEGQANKADGGQDPKGYGILF